MINNFIVVGRIYDVKIEENITKVKLKVQRPYKNENGEYENDFIEFILYKNIAIFFNENYEIDGLAGFKGRIENKNNENKLIVEKMQIMGKNKVK